MAYILSICIPTYNRAIYLPTLLDSIINQVDEQNPVEICISDDGSTDNTRNLIEQYKQQYPHIIYSRWPKNRGYDRNILKVVEIAQGEYCWLMGDDDKVEPGGIRCVLENIRKHCDLPGITVNANIYDISLVRKKPHTNSFIPNLTKDELFINSEEAFSALSCLLTYISSQIIKKSLWDSIIKYNNIGKHFNGYVQMYIIGSIIKSKTKWLYVHEKCTGYRSNKSSVFKGPSDRLKKDLIAFEQTFGYIRETKNTIYRKINTDILVTFFKSRIMNLNCRTEPIFYLTALKLLTKHYWSYPQFWLWVAPRFLIPKRILIILRYVYKKYIKHEELTPYHCDS